MSAPMPEVLADSNLHHRLRQACVLCGQRLVGMARVKAHWQATRPMAWRIVQHRTPGEMQSLKSTFTVPCKYCGSRARNSSQRSSQCHVLFQLCAAREIFRRQRLEAALSESTAPVRRQDKDQPEYKRFEPANSPIGKALRASAAGHSGEPGRDFCALPVPARPASTAALRLATPSTSTTTTLTVDSTAWTLSTIFVNPNVLCYANSSTLALLHIGMCIGAQDPRLDRLRQEILQARAVDSRVQLRRLHSFGELAHGWRFSGRQEGAAEFTLHVLIAMGLRGLWQSRFDGDGGVRVTDQGTMLYLQLPSASGSLQDLIEAWTFQQHVYALSGEWDRVPVVLGRYAWDRKNQARVLLPVFGHGCVLRQARYRVEAALVHLGDEPSSGHYRAILRHQGRWYYTDDGICSCEIEFEEVHACNVYLLWLVKRGL